MKKGLSTLVITCFSVIVLFSTAKTQSLYNISDSSRINKIDAFVALIDSSLSTYKKTVQKSRAYSTESGEIVYYFNGNILKKIEMTYYGEWGRNESNYYYQNAELIKLDYIEFVYSRPIQLSGGVELLKARNTFYFNNFTLIKNINDTTIPCTNAGTRMELLISRLLLLSFESPPN